MCQCPPLTLVYGANCSLFRDGHARELSGPGCLARSHVTTDCAEWESGGLVWRATLNVVVVLIPCSSCSRVRGVLRGQPGPAGDVCLLRKWVWAILCMGMGLTIPFGGIAYLVFGKVRRPHPGSVKESCHRDASRRPRLIRRGPGNPPYDISSLSLKRRLPSPALTRLIGKQPCITFVTLGELTQWAPRHPG